MSSIALKREFLEAPSWSHLSAMLEAPVPHHESFDPALIERALMGVVSEVTAIHSHRFDPQGFSLVVFAARARVFLHTWPERGVSTLDLHCEESVNATELITQLTSHLGWECTSVERHVREP